jgi:hypothetical protein
MYWSRKFRLFDCKDCNYIGVHRNDKRHAEKYICSDGKARPSRILNRKDDVLANKMLNTTSDVKRNCKGDNCNNNRSLQHLYRSNAQPNNNERNYSYSYNDYLRNRRYTNNLPSKKPIVGSTETVGFRGPCKKNDGTCDRRFAKVTWKPSNPKYHTQGAVTSSSRIDRLKLEAVRSEKKCPPGQRTGPRNGRRKCSGKYVGDKERNVGYIFNENHTEIDCPQDNAVGRARGNRVFKCY